MVEKIDKPEPPSPYFVEASAEAKRDRHGGSGTPQQGDEYSGSHAAPGWQQIYSAQSNRKYLKLRREEIARAWFRQAFMQKGISLAEVDIQTKDGRVIRSAHVILSVREDFWTLKRFQPGADVPLNIIAREPVIELSVPGPKPVPQTTSAAVIAPAVKKIDVKKIAIYAGIAIAVLLLLIFALFK